jgi:hypothetical protein
LKTDDPSSVSTGGGVAAGAAESVFSGIGVFGTIAGGGALGGGAVDGAAVAVVAVVAVDGAGLLMGGVAAGFVPIVWIAPVAVGGGAVVVIVMGAVSGATVATVADDSVVDTVVLFVVSVCLQAAMRMSKKASFFMSPTPTLCRSTGR